MISWGIRARERGAITCESCAISKARQKNMNEESTGVKAVKYNGRVYHDIATVKESEEDKSLGRKMVWHITAEVTVNFKRSKFDVAKSNMPKDMCVFMQQEKSRRHPISIIRQDNADENKKLVTLAVGTLKDGYVRNVPLPRVPQIQSASPTTSRDSIAPQAGIPFPGYLHVPSWIPTLPKIGSILGFSQRLL